MLRHVRSVTKDGKTWARPKISSSLSRTSRGRSPQPATSTVAGDTDEARRWAELARSAATDIAEELDRELLLGDLETLPT